MRAAMTAGVGAATGITIFDLVATGRRSDGFAPATGRCISLPLAELLHLGTALGGEGIAALCAYLETLETVEGPNGEQAIGVATFSAEWVQQHTGLGRNAAQGGRSQRAARRAAERWLCKRGRTRAYVARCRRSTVGRRLRRGGTRSHRCPAAAPWPTTDRCSPAFPAPGKPGGRPALPAFPGAGNAGQTRNRSRRSTGVTVDLQRSFPQGVLVRVLVSCVGSCWTGLCSVEDVVGGFGPDEGFAAVVPAVDERFDGGDEVFHRGEGAAADRLPGDDPEEDLHHVQPRAGGRGEVHRDPRVCGPARPAPPGACG